MNVFDMRGPLVGSLQPAFEELARQGIGPHRGRAELAGVKGCTAPKELSLEPDPLAPRRVRVHFVTPTELKSGHQVADRPEFSVLAARIRDRLSTLRQLYDDGPLPIDFRAFQERAAQVRMTHCQIRTVETRRRSSRTGQVHTIGGLVGEAVYEGDLAEFLPYLRAAQWTGVGRQTVWGKGQIEVAPA
jgi:hypothetical protein